MSKSEVSDIFVFFHCNNQHTQKYVVPQGNTFERASYPPVTFIGKWIKFKTNKMLRKGKQRGVDIKQEDILQAVVRKTLIG